ncbi:MAG: hypothetical protein AAGA42_14405 [Actinomycetota bacterium]
MATLSGPDLGARMSKVGSSINAGRRATVVKAAARAERIQDAEISKAAGGDGRMSGVGRRKGRPGGAKVGARAKARGAGVGTSAIVKAIGPVHLLERPTAGRVIHSAYATGRGRRGFIGPTLPGQFAGDRRAVLNVPNIGYRRSVRHPGTRGKRPWKIGRRRAEPVIRKTLRTEMAQIIRKAAR